VLEEDAQDEGPTAASMTSNLTPVVAVTLGVVFVGERLSWNLVAGTIVVLLAVWIAERKPSKDASASDDLTDKPPAVLSLLSSSSNRDH
jgi:hypothetical protein